MPATLIDGKEIADGVLNNLKVQIDALGQPLHLAAICVGTDPGIRSFVKLKQRAAQSIGVIFSSYFFDGDNRNEVIQTIRYLVADEMVQGIFIELPLPDRWDINEIVSLIPSDKDVDALTRTPVVPAPAVLALQYVLHDQLMKVEGLQVAVVGQGRLVGQPITVWLRQQGAHVDVVDIDTPNPQIICSSADLVVTGVGKAGMVTGDWVKDGALVIDFGYGKKPDGTYAGDVDRASVTKKPVVLTQVPGGMGPLVIAAVLENILTLGTR